MYLKYKNYGGSDPKNVMKDQWTFWLWVDQYNKLQLFGDFLEVYNKY